MCLLWMFNCVCFFVTKLETISQTSLWVCRSQEPFLEISFSHSQYVAKYYTSSKHSISTSEIGEWMSNHEKQYQRPSPSPHSTSGLGENVWSQFQVCSSHLTSDSVPGSAPLFPSAYVFLSVPVIKQHTWPSCIIINAPKISCLTWNPPPRPLLNSRSSFKYSLLITPSFLCSLGK